MSKAKIGRSFPKSEEWCKKVSEAKRGRKLSTAHVQALTGVPKTLSDEQRASHSSRMKDRLQPGTSGHFAFQTAQGYVVWKLDEPDIEFYVLNAATFGRDMMQMKGSLSSKLKAICDGTRMKIHGYSARRPTDSELTRYKPMLLQSGNPYMTMSKV
jgi:hypothetical protein